MMHPRKCQRSERKNSISPDVFCFSDNHLQSLLSNAYIQLGQAVRNLIEPVRSLNWQTVRVTKFQYDYPHHHHPRATGASAQVPGDPPL
jgi:hypothetical protein